ncbi:MAG: HAD-IB family phosphatase [Parachlamydiaceae bacterium]|nr:HAD-IB family phosphatase [Parachlamydiaceae bacterium]
MIIFDLDHTLLKVNSSVHFGIFLYKKKIIRTLPFIFSIFDYGCHKWFNQSIQVLYEKSFSRFFKDHRLILIQELADQFVSENLTKLINEPVFKKLEEAKKRNEKTMILSSSPHFLVESISKYLNVDGQGSSYICNEYGIITDSKDVFDGETKAKYIKELSSQYHIPLSKMTTYSDSHLDLPLLKIVGKPVGVSPDRILKQICLENKWEIIE